jgi:hypothetical protein
MKQDRALPICASLLIIAASSFVLETKSLYLQMNSMFRSDSSLDSEMNAGQPVQTDTGVVVSVVTDTTPSTSEVQLADPDPDYKTGLNFEARHHPKKGRRRRSQHPFPEVHKKLAPSSKHQPRQFMTLREQREYESMLSMMKEREWSHKTGIDRDVKAHMVAARQFVPSERLGNRIVYFLHIHKAGGTSLCSAAFRNGMRAESTRNCNVQPDQRCCGNQDSMNAQVVFAKSTNYQFVASEKEMYEAMDVQHYLYVVSLRHSRARYLSHWNHARRSNRQSATTTPFREWWMHQPDNWQFRMICGPSCLNTPKYQISRAQFNHTVDRLRKFESFVFVENFEEGMTKLSQLLGWPTSILQKENVGSRGYHKGDNDEWDINMSVLDESLYEYALQLHQGEATLTLSESNTNQMESYFAEGTKQSCASPCCGECSFHR